MTEADLLGLVQRIYDAALEPKRWGEFVRAFERALGGAGVALCLPHPRAQHRGHIVAPSYDPRLVDRYPGEYLAANPFAPYVERLAVGSFEFGQRCVPEAELERTAFYRDWMAPQGFLPGPSFGGVIDRDAAHGTDAINVFRPRGAPPYGRSQQRLGQLLMPHLQRARQLQRRAGQLGRERTALSAALDCIRIGLILVDSRGRVVATNRAAQRLLAARDGLEMRREGVRGARPATTAALRRLLADAARTATGQGWGAAGGLRLERPSGRRPLDALVTPLRLPVDMASELGPEAPVAALFVGDPDEASEPPHALLGRLYGLTPAEGALACVLATGCSLTEAADRLRISRETARSRLKRVFAKTDTPRQGALIRLLMSGPAHLCLEEPRDD